MADERRWGSLRKLPSGRWQASFTGPDLARHTAPVTFTAKRDAEAFLLHERRLIDVDPSGWRPPKERLAREQAERERAKRTTFGSYSREWLEHRDLTASTRYLYRLLLDKHLLPAFGDTPLVDITRAGVKIWHRQTSPRSATTRANAYRLFRSIMMTAVDDELIDVCPVAIKGASRPSTRDIDPATPEEIERLANAAPEQYRAMVLLAAWAAMRFGELAELRRKDIDTRDGVIRIRRAVSFVPGQEPVIGSPKTVAGKRDVAIPSHLLPMVREHLLAHTEPGDTGLLFPAPRGGNMRPSNDWWPRTREAAGLSHLRFHDLRHAGAVLAAQAGATVKELQSRLGHATPAMALHYQHSTAARDRELAKNLSKMIDSD